MTFKKWLVEAEKQLIQAKRDTLSAILLLGHVLDKSKTQIIAYNDTLISESDLLRLQALLQRRIEGEPLAYILGSKEFYGHDFIVNKNTLIPRSESELIIEKVLEYADRQLLNREVSFIDIGTGSGCLAISLLKERPTWQGLAIDISPAALNIAMQNASFHAVKEKLTFLQCDIAEEEAMTTMTKVKFDIIISNPPYISSTAYAQLEDTVLNYEPKQALIPPYETSNGMELIEKVIEFASTHLNAKGLLVIEHGFDQKEAVLEACAKYEIWSFFNVEKDYAGLDRLLYAVHK